VSKEKEINMNVKNNMSKVDWSKVDWTKQDIVISRNLGCSREAARQARIRLNVGRSIRHRKNTLPNSASRLSEINTDNFTLPELSKMVGCHENRVMALLKQLGKNYKHRPRGIHRKNINDTPYDWSKFPADWYDKTDKEISLVIGTDKVSTVTTWRVRHGFLRYVTSGSEKKVFSAVENTADMVPIFQRKGELC
jgi:hypothetical protein